MWTESCVVVANWGLNYEGIGRGELGRLGLARAQDNASLDTLNDTERYSKGELMVSNYQIKSEAIGWHRESENSRAFIVNSILISDHISQL